MAREEQEERSKTRERENRRGVGMWNTSIYHTMERIVLTIPDMEFGFVN
jgi:hypothetical protein